ncbi:LuxR C-terminal-related transcriptional regulator [Cohnella zeiphila]|uniref:AAA family ATPase n=1 Tax=Cohnella zeiphila TaxID=2761120 RepID=A0A7X0VY34_9BACL|nr:LuxR C-terminal-related transcriptional regulator [Cohnella zeiphila]MBB6734077.1 AAA family ATPase [Cohnella zeiphila]
MNSNGERDGRSASRSPIPAVKLTIPAAVPSTLIRQRLIHRIHQNLKEEQTRALLLFAPAGFGKTTLLQHWAEWAGTDPAWVTLDPGDNDPARFWHHAIRAIGRVRPGFGERADEAAVRMGPDRSETALNRLLDELRQWREELVLVLDDFHAIRHEALLSSLSYWIGNLPANVRLIVAGRSEPALFSAEWAAAPRIGADDLRFSLQEGIAFYSDCMELELSKDEAGDWAAQAEGWIAGMKLAALSQRGAAPSEQLLPSFASASRLIDQYLLEEVWLHQSEDIRRFLLECSVLRTFCPPLCEAVAGSDRSRELLGELERAQLFVVPLEYRKGWFRFHRLFAEFLRRLLQRTEPDRTPQLLERAGRWRESAELPEEALDDYLSGGHYEKAIELLTRMPAIKPGVGTVWGSEAFARIPGPILSRHPYLYFSYVYSVLVGEADYDRAEKMLRDARSRYEDHQAAWTEEERNEFWGGYYFLKMYVALNVLHDPGQVELNLRLSRQYAPAGIRLIPAKPRFAGLPSVIRERRPGSSIADGRQRVVFLRSVLAPLEEAGAAAVPLACLAELQYEFNQLDEAESYAAKALASGDPAHPDRMAVLLPARLVQFRIQKLRGERVRATETLQEARRELAEHGMTDSLVYCDAELALMALEEGHAGPALAWRGQYSLRPGDAVGDRQLYGYQCLARLAAAQGRDDEALRLAEKLLELAIRTDRFQVEIELAVLKLVLLRRTGRTDEALPLLRSVLHASELRGYRRTLLDAGQPLAELLTLLAESWEGLQEGDGPSPGYVRELLLGFGWNWTGGSFAGPAPGLTRKEREVLRLIVGRRTNKEIADELGIGIGTVKSHIKRIYSKLEAGSRAEAIWKGALMEL